MKRSSILLPLLFCWLCFTAQAQDKSKMNDYQQRLQHLFDQVYTAPTDNERYLANETALALLQEAVLQENSIKWQWDFGNRVSVLTTQDAKFRIFSWPVVRDNGEYECFGMMQIRNEKSDEYDIYPLTDKSEEIINREESTLGPDQWLGAVYQEIITSTYDGKNYYTLLGWNGVDHLTQRKIIEPVCFKGSSSQPIFGQPLFRKERNLRRIVLEYTKTAMVAMHYEEQYVRRVELIRAKRKTKKASRKNPQRSLKEKIQAAPTKVAHDEKLRMIIFDEVEPQVAGMEGLFQYYVPSGREMAYVFVNGKWELREGAQGRIQNRRLNKEFKPIEKNAPSYKLWARDKENTQ